MLYIIYTYIKIISLSFHKYGNMLLILYILTCVYL